jgi:hypothetical protein
MSYAPPLHTLSVVALNATFRREASSVVSGGFANPPWSEEGVHRVLALHSLAAGLPTRRGAKRVFIGLSFLRR